MMIRHQAAIKALPLTGTVEERLRLLDAVVCPGPRLLAVSLREADDASTDGAVTADGVRDLAAVPPGTWARR